MNNKGAVRDIVPSYIREIELIPVKEIVIYEMIDYGKKRSKELSGHNKKLYKPNNYKQYLTPMCVSFP